MVPIVVVLWYTMVHLCGTTAIPWFTMVYHGNTMVILWYFSSRDAPLPRQPDVANLLSTPSQWTGNSPISYGTLTHARHTLSRHDDVGAAKHVQLSPFSTSLEPSFRDTHGSLNFLSVHSCSQNLPLISCMSAYKFHWGLKMLGLISITGVKHLQAF